MSDRSYRTPPGGPVRPGLPRFDLLTVRGQKAPIFALVGLLLLLVAVMIGLRRYGETEPAREIGGGVPTPELERTTFDGMPAFDMSLAERLADSGPDARRRWPSEAVNYLLLEAAYTPAVHAYRKNLLPLDSGSAAEIERNSRPWRFKYVRFRGELEYIREEEYAAVYGPEESTLGRVHRGRVRLADTDPPRHVVFLTPAPPYWTDPNGPEARPELALIEDGWVRGRGILVQNYVEGTGDAEVPALLVVATLVERDYETVPVRTLADIPFDIIRDNPKIAAEEDGRAILAKSYDRPLFRLVRYAQERAGAAGAARRAEEKLEAKRLPTAKEWEELHGHPEKFRAHYFGGLGVVAMAPLHLTPETIPANDAGVEECLNGWILTDEQKLLQFLAPVELGTEWKKRTRIRWEGFFYKSKLYPAQDGTDRFAPVFVLTRLEEVKLPRPSQLVHIVIAAGFVLGIGLLIFVIVREDRTKESYRRLRRRRVASP